MHSLRSTFGLAGVRITDNREMAARGDRRIRHHYGLPDATLPLRSGEGRPVHQQLELFGRRTSAEQRVLRVLADQVAVALENEQLARGAAQAQVLAEIDTVRTGLLRAVSHDLRTRWRRSRPW